MNKAELVESVQKALGKETTKRLAEEAVAAVLKDWRADEDQSF